MSEKKEGRIRYKAKFQGFEIDAFRNANTGEEFYDPKQAERILVFNKLRNKMFRTTAGQIQNNIIWLRVEVSKAVGIKKGEEVKIKIEDTHKISIEV
ncbi:MAG TPA: hypothetical protein VI979_02580 [archaeon]|nr:hypothetical protein [archaeon]